MGNVAQDFNFTVSVLQGNHVADHDLVLVFESLVAITQTQLILSSQVRQATRIGRTSQLQSLFAHWTVNNSCLTWKKYYAVSLHLRSRFIYTKAEMTLRQSSEAEMIYIFSISRRESHCPITEVWKSCSKERLLSFTTKSPKKL